MIPQTSFPQIQQEYSFLLSAKPFQASTPSKPSDSNWSTWFFIFLTLFGLVGVVYWWQKKKADWLLD